MRVPRRFRCCSKFSLITSDSQAGPLHKLSKLRLAELIPMHRARRTRQSYRCHRRGEPSRHTGARRFLSPSGAQPRLSNGFAEPRRSDLNAQTKPSAARHSPPFGQLGAFMNDLSGTSPQNSRTLQGCVFFILGGTNYLTHRTFRASADQLAGQVVCETPKIRIVVAISNSIRAKINDRAVRYTRCCPADI